MATVCNLCNTCKFSFATCTPEVITYAEDKDGSLSGTPEDDAVVECTQYESKEEVPE